MILVMTNTQTSLYHAEDEYATHVIDTITAELEKTNSVINKAVIDVDPYIESFNAPKSIAGIETEPFMCLSVAIKPVDSENMANEPIKAISIDDHLLSAIEIMRGLGYYVKMNIVSIVPNKWNKNPFELLLEFYSDEF